MSQKFTLFQKPLSFWLVLIPLLSIQWVCAATAAQTLDEAAGRQIYLEGVRPNGQALHGMRSEVGEVTGKAAACVSCHRPSGLGMTEGTVDVPPVSGNTLFGGDRPVYVRMDRRFNPGLSTPHAPYDAESFAAAVRSGRHQTGRTLDVVMPRYDLSDAELQALASYLKTLSSAWSPGATEDTIHLATVIAPGVDENRRQAFLSTLNTAISQMNMNAVSGKRQKVSIVERRLQSRRKLSVDVWELSGPSSTWAQQLDQRFLQQPVFAILSGLAKDEWQPVQDFCEMHQVGCWFPSVDLVPATAEQSHYSLYFSAGIQTEADVMARGLIAAKGQVLQLLSADVVSHRGAEVLRRKLTEAGGQERLLPDITLNTQDKAQTTAALAALTANDTLVLWLRPQDLSSLSNYPSTNAQVLIAATLAGDPLPVLPQAWRNNTRIVQQFEPAERRDVNLERFDAWQKASKVALVDRRMQSEVYFAARSLLVTLRGMLNNLYTDYLIERAEATLSMFEAMQVQDELQAMMMSPVSNRPPVPAPTLPSELSTQVAAEQAQQKHLEAMRNRTGTTVYPRLSLGQGQRFASKGAYVTRLNPEAPGMLGDPLWVVP